MARITGLDVNVETLVDTRFDETDVSFLPPPPTTAPEDESKDRKEEDPQNRTHNDPRDGTLRSAGPRGRSVKEL